MMIKSALLLLLVARISALRLEPTHLFAQPPFPVGTTITPTGSIGVDVVINYKLSSFFGWGGNQQVRFTVFTYQTPKGELPVFIQQNRGYSIDGPKTVDASWGYGFSSGLYFLVQLDSMQKSAGIYQWRFLNALGKNPNSKKLALSVVNILQSIGNGRLGGTGFDLTSLFGDPLRSF